MAKGISQLELSTQLSWLWVNPKGDAPPRWAWPNWASPERRWEPQLGSPTGREEAGYEWEEGHVPGTQGQLLEAESRPWPTTASWKKGCQFYSCEEMTSANSWMSLEEDSWALGEMAALANTFTSRGFHLGRGSEQRSQLSQAWILILQNCEVMSAVWNFHAGSNAWGSDTRLIQRCRV